jgi:GTP cyclohydrolase I
VTPPPPPADAGAPAIDDVQSRRDERQVAIDKAGIRDLAHPVRVSDRSRREQHTVARVSMSVELPKHFKGTHMSRFIEILHREREVSVADLGALLQETAARLEADAAHIEIEFPFFVMKRAPVSGVESLMDYRVTLSGTRRDGVDRRSIRVVVPVTSLCPCSKKISERGAHNQRSHVTITAQLRGSMWIEDLIDIAESEASSELYAILKRPDEKFVTERAYDNPKFVEDLVRDVALRLDREPQIAAYRVEVENFESIHNHSAYALVERGPDPADQRATGS